jgi:type I restriction enzyme S subunit
VPLGDLTTLISSGSTPKGGSEVYVRQGPVMLIRSQNVRMNALVLDDVAYVTDEIDAQMVRSRVKCGDVLLNITGASIGRVATFDLEHVEANVNQHVCIIRPRPDALFGR